jgi:hypothetical protein
MSQNIWAKFCGGAHFENSPKSFFQQKGTLPSLPPELHQGNVEIRIEQLVRIARSPVGAASANPTITPPAGKSDKDHGLALFPALAPLVLEKSSPEFEPFPIVFFQ